MPGLVPGIRASMRPSVSPARTTPPSCPDSFRASMSPLTFALSSRFMPRPAPTFRVSGYPAISIGRARRRAVDARNESGHDGVREWPGREASHPETETGFPESLILKRDSPGLSGISGISWDSTGQHPIRETPKRPPDVSASRALRAWTYQRHGRACSGYPGIHEAARSRLARTTPPSCPDSFRASSSARPARPWAITWMAGTSPAMTRVGAWAG